MRLTKVRLTKVRLTMARLTMARLTMARLMDADRSLAALKRDQPGNDERSSLKSP